MRLTPAINTRYFFPSKLMEYLASAVPVISTCTGAVEEEFGSFVHLLRKDSEGLAQAIRAVAALSPAARADIKGSGAAVHAGQQDLGCPGPQNRTLPSRHATFRPVVARRRGGLSCRLGLL